MPLTLDVANWARQVRRAGLPEAIRDQVRLHVADAVGIGLAAGADAALCSQVSRALSLGSKGGACVVLGETAGRSPLEAAFGNAARIHLLDFDDIHDQARLHPTTVTLSAALAAAELCDAPFARVLDAVAIGNELMCRLGVVCTPRGAGPGADWFLTQLFGYFGASLAASVALDLDEQATASALGLAYMQAAGSKEAGFGTGSTARAIYPAFAAQAGTLASLLAASGVQGPPAAFEGLAGLFKLYLGLEAGSASAAVLGGGHWAFSDTCIKPWPSCRFSHPYVAAALRARTVLAGHIPERVVARVNATAARLCHPLDERRAPRTLQDAKYSIPFMIAFTLVRGEVSLGTLTHDALDDPAVLAMARRIEVEPGLPDRPGLPEAEIELITAGVPHRITPDLPMALSREAVQAKFIACVRSATSHRAEALFEALIADEDPLASKLARTAWPAPRAAV